VSQHNAAVTNDYLNRNLALLLPRLRGTELPSTEGSISHKIKPAAITALHAASPLIAMQ